jgi:dCMP deaminase
MPDLPLWYEDRERKYQRIIHAEMNALIQAKQSVEGCTLYTWPFMCCDRCIVHLAQAGIIKFIYPSAQPDAQIRWNENFERALLFLDYMHLSSLEILREEIE